MAEDEEGKKTGNGKHSDWTKVAGTIAGAVLLGLQGINLSEINHGNHNGEKRMETLQQLLVISKNIDASLKNQTRMLEHDEQSEANQKVILDTINKAINERRDLLQKNLDLLQKNLEEFKKSPPSQ
jgi:hypothetical protein